MNNSVDFDPGIGALVIDFNTFINDIYSPLMNLHSISQKRTRFKLVVNKIYSAIENNIAFYLGCLLWAYYIKTSFSLPQIISGNLFLDLSPDEIKNYDYLIQIEFMENYFDSFERDTQYYVGKKIEIPRQWKKILSVYKDFLVLNKGFVKTKSTNDLLLPGELNNKSFSVDILSLINESIQKQNLNILLNSNVLF